MTDINEQEILFEQERFLRNSDIMTITERNVTTDTDEGTFAADETHLIAVTNIKNIRSITVGGSPLSFGKDYTYDMDFPDTTIKTKITFTTAQTGVYVITYDYGTDKIGMEWDKTDLKISSFPRISILMIDLPSEPGGYGNVILNTINFSCIVYGPNKKDIRNYIASIRKAYKDAWIDFYYTAPVIRPVANGPILPSPDTNDKIFQQNVDFRGSFNYEKG